MTPDKTNSPCDKNCLLTSYFNLTRDIIWMLATYPPQLATRYDLFEYDVKIMFSILIIAGTATFEYPHSEGTVKTREYQVIPGNDKNTSPTNQKTAGSELERTS